MPAKPAKMPGNFQDYRAPARAGGLKPNKEDNHYMEKIMGLMVMCIVLALVCPVLAQPQSGGGRGMGPQLYNPQTVTTVAGQVESLENLPPMGPGGGRGMMHLTASLKTDQGSITIHLGPAWYLEQQQLALKIGDALEVTGSKVTLNQKPTIIAKELRVNGKTLKLRDEQGFPLWRGMGPGGGPGR